MESSCAEKEVLLKQIACLQEALQKKEQQCLLYQREAEAAKAETQEALRAVEMLQKKLPQAEAAASTEEDQHHLARVEALLETESPDSTCWMQRWPGVAQVHHLNLDSTQIEQLPESPPQEAQRDCSSEDWEQYYDPSSQKSWWFNAETGEATWTNPFSL
jgi:hypothetical protein